MKYRIKYRNLCYYPQYKGSFFWHNFCGMWGCEESFSTYEKALARIDQHKAVSHPVGILAVE